RSISAAANPAAPPPTITIRSGLVPSSLAPALRRSDGGTFSRTKSLPSRCSTRQRDIGLNAGAAAASPVRRLKQAWCQGQRTVSPTISPSASGPPGHAFKSRVRAMGIRDRPISPGSPWQNPYMERLIGTVRRECLDGMLVFGEAHLRQILSSYAAYYNEVRTHLALG